MKITQLTLPVSDVAAVAAYFSDVLQLPVAENRVQIGWSTILFEDAGNTPVGGVHLAFNVPDNRFAAAEAWLRERSPLQQDPDGKEYFALESNWQSQSVYFTGPDELILELISRKRLPVSDEEGPFHGSEMTCLSEVGLPCSDVPSRQSAIETQFGVAPLSPASPQFAPMGDDEGLLILVDAERKWFPECRVLPNGAGLRVVVSDVQGSAVLHDEEHGWQVSAR